MSDQDAPASVEPIYFKVVDQGGAASYGVATDADQVPNGAVTFPGAEAYRSEILGSYATPRADVIEASCAAAITGGFSSAALGTPHWYGSRMTDQANLDADMMAAASGGASTTADIACSADSGATWAVTAHDAAQIGQVWADFRAWRVACQVKKRALQGQIAAAPDAASVAAISW